MKSTDSLVRLEDEQGVLELSLIPVEYKNISNDGDASSRDKIRKKIDELNEQLSECADKDAVLTEEIDRYTSKVDMNDYFFSLSAGMVCGVIGAFSDDKVNLRKLGIADCGGLIGDAYENIRIFMKRFGGSDSDKKEEGWFSSFFTHVFRRYACLSKVSTKVSSKVDAVWNVIEEVSHDASLIGLACSVFIQLYHWKNGNFVPAVSDGKPSDGRYLVGTDSLTGVIAGTLNWFGDCVWQMSHRGKDRINFGKGPIKPILKVAKELADIPGAENIFLPTMFSGLLENNDFGIHPTNDDKWSEIARDETLIGLNEGIVRSFYILCQLRDDVVKHGWGSMAWRPSISVQNRTLSRMLAVALTGSYIIHMSTCIARSVSDTYYLGKVVINLNYYYVNSKHVKRAILIDIEGGKIKRSLENERWRNSLNALRLHQVKVAYWVADAWVSVLDTQKSIEALAQCARNATESIRREWKFIDELFSEINGIDIGKVKEKNPGLLEEIGKLLW